MMFTAKFVMNLISVLLLLTGDNFLHEQPLIKNNSFSSSRPVIPFNSSRYWCHVSLEDSSSFTTRDAREQRATVNLDIVLDNVTISNMQLQALMQLQGRSPTEREVTLLKKSTMVVQLLLSFLLMSVAVSIGNGQCLSRVTNPNIRDLVFARCLDFQLTIRPEQFCQNGNFIGGDCRAIAESFVSAFAFQSTCNVSVRRFDPYIRAAETVIPRDRALFWSGVHHYMNRRGLNDPWNVAVGDTLAGYIGGGLTFCGQLDPPGIIFDRPCPISNPLCLNTALFSFWSSVSRRFSESVSGQVTILLNASWNNAYDSQSFLAQSELPYLDPRKVTQVKIDLIHVPDHPIRSTCQSASIDDLKRYMQFRNITAYCQHSPRGPQTLLCADLPKARECRGLGSIYSGGVSFTSELQLQAFIAVAALLYLVYRF